MKANMQMALGNYDTAEKLYENAFKNGFRPGGIKLASILMENNLIDSAEVILNSLADNSSSLVEFLITSAKLKLMRGETDNNLIDPAIGRALTRIKNVPFDPVGHFNAGRSYALKGDYEKSSEYLNMALFLEDNPDHIGSILLELGNLEDLNGAHDKAIDYYNRVINSDSGKYIKSLAEKYRDKPFSYKLN